MLRKLIWFASVVALLLVLVVGVAIFLIYRSKDELVRSGAERAIAHSLDVPATVHSASLDLASQTVELRGIHIPNPKGFSNEDALVLDLVHVEVDVASFRTNERIIRLIRIEKVDALLEKTLTSTNLQELVKNSTRVAEEDAKKAPTAEPSEAKLIIQKLLVNDTNVRVRLPVASLLTSKAAVNLKLADLEMNDIGGEGEKVSPAEAMQRFLALLLESIRRTGKGVLPEDLINSIDGTLGGLPGDVTREAEAAAGKVTAIIEGAAVDAVKTGEKAVEDVKDAVGGVTGKIGGLLGGDKKESDTAP